MPARPKTPPKPTEDTEFGVRWNVPLNELQKRLFCARYKRGNVSTFEHRKRIIQMLWPDYEWHEWLETRLKGFCDYNFTTWWGPAACMSGDSILVNPITGREQTMEELYRSGEQPIVMTLAGPIKASPVYLKGHDSLYRITLKSGNTFKVSAAHRILCSSGYVRAEQLRIGDTLPSWDQLDVSLNESSQVHSASILDNDQSVHVSSVPCSQRTTANFQENCSIYSRPGDGRLPSYQDIDQSSVPSQGDVQKCTKYAYGHSDDSECKPRRTPFGLTFDLPSIEDWYLPTRAAEAKPVIDSSSRIPSPELALFESLLQLKQLKLQKITFGELSHDETHILMCDNRAHLGALEKAYGYTVLQDEVVSITRTEPQNFYDLTVPFVHHYFAGGVIHHNSAKTSDAAIAALEYWIEAPHETAVLVCSTTKDMLRTRIWGEIVKWHGRINPEYRNVVLPEGYGELLDASCFIRWKDGDWKNGIKGIAIQDGPVQEAVNNIIGMHTTRVFVLLDEMQGVREAIMGAIPNLLKNPESKFHGMGNPSDLNSLLCRASEPIGGWKQITKFQPEWDIDSQGYPGVGHCFFFDGRQSPACKDPQWAKRNPWMINQAQIDSHLNSGRIGGNENHPDFMWQTIGWPPEKGLEETVLDMSVVNRFLLKERPIWTSRTTDFAAIDPGFEGADDAVLQLMRRGTVKEDGVPERTLIAGVEQIVVPIDANSEVPIDYQIVWFVRDLCKSKGIPASEVAVPSAGRGAALVSIFRTEWGMVNSIQEGGAPSERPVDERGRTAKEFYNTRASELCMAIRDFALGNALRNVPQEVIEQACARYTFTVNGKFCAEPKKGTKSLAQARGQGAKGFKERLGYSPDHLDAWNIGLEHARQKGAESGFGSSAPVVNEDWDKQLREVAVVTEDYAEDDWKYEASERFMDNYV